MAALCTKSTTLARPVRSTTGGDTLTIEVRFRCTSTSWSTR